MVPGGQNRPHHDLNKSGHSRMKFISKVLLLYLVAFPGGARATWSPEFGPTGFQRSGPIKAVTSYNGSLVVAGEFTFASRDTAHHIARWNGAHWLPMAGGLPRINCLTVHNGTLVAGGSFKANKHCPATALARWDGENWQDMGAHLQGEVNALLTYRDELVVGGRFIIEGGEGMRHIARWDGARWLPLGEGISGGGRTRVEALAVHDDELIVGGVLGQAGQEETFHLARWNGERWLAFGTGADDVVRALVYLEDRLYVAGDFHAVDGVAANGIAAWDGQAFAPLGTGISSEDARGPRINCLEVWQGRLVVAGRFDQAGGRSVGSIATWDGRQWGSTISGLFMNPRGSSLGEVMALLAHDQKLVAVGKMQGGRGYLVNNLGLWDGARWDPLVTGQGCGRSCDEFKSLGGRLFVESSEEVGPGNGHGIQVWEEGQWQAFPGAGDQETFFRTELKLMAEHDGHLVALGHLMDDSRDGSRDGNPWYLARWEGLWRVLTPPLDLKIKYPSQVLSVGDDVVILGTVSGEDESTDRGIYWNGEQWLPLGLGEEPGGISATAVSGDRLFLGLRYRDEDKGQVLQILEWADHRWRVIRDREPGTVRALGSWRGRLMAFLRRPYDPNALPSGLEQWDGETWQTLPGSFSYRYPGDGSVSKLIVYQDHLVASGNFNGVDGLACSKVAFLDGDTWRPLAGGVDGEAHQMAVTPGSLWLGGSFQKAGAQLSQRVARWDGPLPLEIPLHSLPVYEPKERSEVLQGDGWHSHGLDMDEPATAFANGALSEFEDGVPVAWHWTQRQGKTCSHEMPGIVALSKGGVILKTCPEHGGEVGLTQRFSMRGDVFYRVRATYQILAENGSDWSHPLRMTLGDYARRADGYEYGSLHNGIHEALVPGPEKVAEIILRTAPEATTGVLRFHISGPAVELRLHHVAIDTIQLRREEILRQLIAELRGNLVLQNDRVVDWDDLENRFAVPGLKWEGHITAQVLDLLREVGEPRVMLESGESDGSVSMIVAQPAPLAEEDKLGRNKLESIGEHLMDWSGPYGNPPRGLDQGGTVLCAPALRAPQR